ncbi:MAG: DUF3499 family protein [Actinomycetota bacterium]
MRTCAKMRCADPPSVTVTLRYQQREVVIGALVPESDPNLLDLCREHAGRMTPPQGWTLRAEVGDRDPIAV